MLSININLCISTPQWIAYILGLYRGPPLQSHPPYSHRFQENRRRCDCREGTTVCWITINIVLVLTIRFAISMLPSQYSHIHIQRETLYQLTKIPCGIKRTSIISRAFDKVLKTYNKFAGRYMEHVLSFGWDNCLLTYLRFSKGCVACAPGLLLI